MSCQNCHGDRIARISAKCNDMFSMSLGDVSHLGYVPYDMNIGGGDYIEFRLCLDCGQIQGTWPLAAINLEGSEDDKDDEEELD